MRRSASQLPYSPPIQLSLIVRPHADCKNKQGSWIVVKFWESFSLDCLFCKNIFENFAFFLFPQLRVLYPNILQNPPSIPDWGFPLFPLVGDCVGKLFWPFHTWYFSHLDIFSDILYVLCIQQIKKSINCNWQSCILSQWLYCKVVLILPLLTYHIRSKNCCKCVSHQ